MVKKVKLVEALELLQELDFMGGPGMEFRPDYTSGQRDPKNSPRNWRSVNNKNTAWPFEDETGTGPANATGRTGQQGVGRGGVGLGGREDVSGGIRAPSAAYLSTWNQDDLEESPDFDELGRHGSPRNLWHDTPEGKGLNKSIEDDQMKEAMGTPYNFTQAYGHGNNMMAATNPGVQTGWARSPNLGDDDEDNKMKLNEFFDPSPIPVEEIDNPEQDEYGDSTDDELEAADDEHGEHEESDDDELNQQLAQTLSMGDEEPSQPGDGNDLGEPENILLMPHMGANDFVMSPDKMGSARGTYGMHSDGALKSSTVEKSSAWDVLSKVVNSIAADDEPELPGIEG